VYLVLRLKMSSFSNTLSWIGAELNPDQATLQGSSCTSIMTCTGGCGYSF